MQGDRHHLNNFIPELLAHTGAKYLQIYQTLLKIIVGNCVTERPGRAEPTGAKASSSSLPFDRATQKPVTSPIADCLKSQCYSLTRVPFMLNQILNSHFSGELETLLVLIVLIFLEAVLSADNAIALAAIAQGLEDSKPQRQRLTSVC